MSKEGFWTIGEIRVEKDTMGELEVPADRYFGAQTARSLINFDIGTDTMPPSVIRAFGILKQAAAETNVESWPVDPQIGALISSALRRGNLWFIGRTFSHFEFGKPIQEHRLT